MSWPEESTFEDVTLYLAGPVLGFLLRIRGIVALHASAVEIDHGAVVFAGPAGAGKSTMAAAFASLGYPVVTEDIAAIRVGEPFQVERGCPHVGLWPDSVEMLFGAPDALRPFTPGWAKRCLDLPTTAHGSVPIRMIYVMSRREASVRPDITCMPPRDAMLALVAHVYGNRLLHRELRDRELDIVHRLAGSVPVRAAVPAAGASALFELCDLIVADVRQADSVHESAAVSSSRAGTVDVQRP